jgi:hypothetical protein
VKQKTCICTAAVVDMLHTIPKLILQLSAMAGTWHCCCSVITHLRGPLLSGTGTLYFEA